MVLGSLLLSVGLLSDSWAEEPFRNHALIEASAMTNGGVGGHHSVQLPNNAGTKIFENDELAIHLTGNQMRPKKPGQNLTGNERLFFESDPCERITTPWVRNSGMTINVASVVVVLKKSPSFELTRHWLWYELRPILRSEVADRYCGGKIEYVFATFFIYGYEIRAGGKIEMVVDREYQEFDLGSELERRRLLKFPILALASAQFYFWDKFSPELKAVYEREGMVNENGLRFPEYGVNAPQGSYYEVFNPRMPHGGSESFYRESTSLESFARSNGKILRNPPDGYVEYFTQFYEDYKQHLAEQPMFPEGSQELEDWNRKHRSHQELTQAHRNMIQDLLRDEYLVDGIEKAYEKFVSGRSGFELDQVKNEFVTGLSISLVSMLQERKAKMLEGDAVLASRKLIDSILKTEPNSTFVNRFYPYIGESSLAICQRLNSGSSFLEHYVDSIVLERVAEEVSRTAKEIKEAAERALEKNNE